MSLRNRKRGVALITAMLISAITASVAAGLATDNALDVRRTMVLLFHEQGTQVALGAEAWVKNILRDDAIQSTDDHLGEIWASELPALPVDNGSVQGAVTGQLVDLEGRFNVNKLVGSDGKVSPVYLRQFERLLRALELDPRYAGLAADWIDGDQQAGFPNGAEDGIYTGMTPPYRAYNRGLTNVSELAALEGMSQAEFRVLLPHITALPSNSAINVNTASIPVLRSLGDNIDPGVAESLVEQRDGIGFGQDFQKVFANHLDPDLQKEQPLSIATRYFQLKAVVQIDTVRLTYFSVLHRAAGGGPVTVLARSQGTY